MRGRPGASRTPAGQTIAFPSRRFSTLEIRVAGTSDHRHRLFGGADSVGIAEIRLRDRHADHDVRVDEVIQMPQDLLDAVGEASASQRSWWLSRSVRHSGTSGCGARDH